MNDLRLKGRKGIRRLRMAQSRRSGFTLVELMVAVLIITVGLLGLVSVAGSTTRMIGEGIREQSAAVMAVSRFELNRSVQCSALTVPSNGKNVRLGVNEHWTIASNAGLNSAFKTLLLTDTLQYQTAVGTTRRRVFTTLRTCP